VHSSHRSVPTPETVWEFAGLLWDSLKGAPTIIGIVATLLTFAISPDAKLSARWSVLGLVLAATIIVALLEATWRAVRTRTPDIPRVLYGRKAPAEYQNAVVLCLLESSDRYSFGDLVSFYYVDEHNFEALIGVGAVSNVQRDGTIQVVLETPIAEQMELIDRLSSNDETVKRRVRVKPTIQRRVTYADRG